MCFVFKELLSGIFETWWEIHVLCWILGSISAEDMSTKDRIKHGNTTSNCISGTSIREADFYQMHAWDANQINTISIPLRKTPYGCRSNVISTNSTRELEAKSVLALLYLHFLCSSNKCFCQPDAQFRSKLIGFNCCQTDREEHWQGRIVVV